MNRRRLNSIRAVVTALAVVATLCVSAPAEAGPIQLGFILDGSGSIGPTNWTTIRNGLASAVNAYVPLGSQYEVSVVTFGTSATQNIKNFVVSDAASKNLLVNSIANLPYLNGGSTNYAAAFTAMQQVLQLSISNASFSYVNFATDGQQNSGGTGVTERNSLIAAGVDNISIEGIGSSVDANDLQTNFCYPGPCTIAPVYNFPTKGFYVGVADAAGYAAAIGEKVEIVTTVPDLGSTLALFGVALVGLQGLRRRFHA